MKIGDVVNIPMTITQIGADTVECTWFIGAKLYRETFDFDKMAAIENENLSTIPKTNEVHCRVLLGAVIGALLRSSSGPNDVRNALQFIQDNLGVMQATVNAVSVNQPRPS